jgi:hypothetical protein
MPLLRNPAARTSRDHGCRNGRCHGDRVHRDRPLVDKSGDDQESTGNIIARVAWSVISCSRCAKLRVTLRTATTVILSVNDGTNGAQERETTGRIGRALIVTEETALNCRLYGLRTLYLSSSFALRKDRKEMSKPFPQWRLGRLSSALPVRFSPATA